MKTTAKFRLQSITDWGSTSKRYNFTVDYDKSGISEDEHFAKYTPSGSLEITVDNPNVNAMFDGQQGKCFYLMLMPVE